MQDRYVGDVGDYVKLAILRAIMPGARLGVAWWLYPDESHNSDGRHITYLSQPSEWKRFDPDLFDGLRRIVDRGERTVEALEKADFLPGAIFHNERIPTMGHYAHRKIDRHQWFSRAKQALADCDLIFVDPDNGLETKNFDAGAAKAGKSTSLAELTSLRRSGRSLVVYHHQTRMPGGHEFELIHWGGRLRAAGFDTVDALRASAYSARAFFFLNATSQIRENAQQLSERWGHRLTWHPSLG